MKVSRGSYREREKHKMPLKNSKLEQIIVKLMEAEIRPGQGGSLSRPADLAISEQAFYWWRKEFGSLRLSQVQRLKGLRQENELLRWQEADWSLDDRKLKNQAGKCNQNTAVCLIFKVDHSVVAVHLQKNSKIGFLCHIPEFQSDRFARVCIEIFYLGVYKVIGRAYSFESGFIVTSFYSKLLNRNGIDKESRLLVVCGGEYDKFELEAAGFTNATISNISEPKHPDVFLPFKFACYDAEDLSLEDASFDWVIVHDGLHHCLSPHRALCEMLRVARIGVLVIESSDNFLMQIALRLGMVPKYELEPAHLSSGKSGGVRNQAIPNYVYRWTEREVEKTACSAIPERELRFEYFYDYRIPLDRLSMNRSIFMRSSAMFLRIAKPLLTMLFARQGNSFAFSIRKDGPLKPWLKLNNGNIEVNLDYINKIYSNQ